MGLVGLTFPWGPIFQSEQPNHEGNDPQLQGQVGQEIGNVMTRQNLHEKNEGPDRPGGGKGEIGKQAKTPVGSGGFGPEASILLRGEMGRARG